MCERYIYRLSLMRPQMGTWPETQACALTGNQTGDLLVHRLALNPLSHTSQGLNSYFLNKGFCTITNYIIVPAYWHPALFTNAVER